METIANQKKFILKNSIFTDDIKNFIFKEGFVFNSDSNSSCSAGNTANSGVNYRKTFGYTTNNNQVKTFIFNEGIGVDIDFSHGENQMSVFWKFSNHKNFNEAYNRMLYFVNNHLKPQHKLGEVWFG